MKNHGRHNHAAKNHDGDDRFIGTGLSDEEQQALSEAADTQLD